MDDKKELAILKATKCPTCKFKKQCDTNHGSVYCEIIWREKKIKKKENDIENIPQD